MPGMATTPELANRVAALEHDMELVKNEVTRVLKELVTFLKEGGFRNIDQYVKL